MPSQRKRTLARPVKPATLAFAREARRTPDYSLLDWIHGYVYARWPYLYIGIGTGEHPLARFVQPVVGWFLHLFPPKDAAPTFADTYHGKVLPLKAATQLVTIEEEISLTDLEQVIPYTRARDIILRNPHHIVALDCPCRVARPDPCLPLDVCLVIGEPFAGFVAAHHPGQARWITPQEAVDILRAEDERGHVHHAFFKDAMLNRFYAICNCCTCCCGAIQAHQNGTPMLASSGYVCCVDSDACIGCGICTDFCQFDALSMNGETVIVDGAECMGCGVCIHKCPQEALSLLRDPSRGEPLEIHQLTASVTS